MNFNPVEKKIIELIRERSRTTGEIPGLGIGDDAAFLLLSSMEESKLVVSTDSVIENVHYKTSWCNYADIAVKLIERASSDILAKGGHPHWALLNMNITKELSVDEKNMIQFIDAFCQKLKDHNIALIGGDISRSATNSFTMTVLGNTSTFIRRKNTEIEKGDLVVMWGCVGGSSFALTEFLEGRKPDDSLAALYRRPQAGWQNEWLTKLHCKASMDQSDSLMETLETLSIENNVNFKINLDMIPLSQGVDQSLKEKIYQNILTASEDLAIIAVIPYSEAKNIVHYNHITVIGEILEKTLSEKEAGVFYFWKNENIKINQIPKSFFREFYHHF